MHDGGQLREDVRVRLGRVGICSHGDLEHREAKRPYIRGHCICSEVILGFAPDTFGLYVNRLSVS
jgi:hypothetical protein